MWLAPGAGEACGAGGRVAAGYTSDKQEPASLLYLQTCRAFSKQLAA